jgi:uncharacterized protein with HEPN domain
MSKGKSSSEYLQDLLDYLDKAAAFTTEGRDAFYADEMIQLAVIRVYEVIGEIVKRLPAELRDENPQINWRKLAGFRDFLSHNYDEIILAFVWQAIEDLENLRTAVQAVKDALPTEE